MTNNIKEPRGEMYKKDAIQYLINIRVLTEKNHYGKAENSFIRRTMTHGKLPRQNFIKQGRAMPSGAIK